MTEKYSPQKHEWGKEASASWAKSMTPGQEGTIGIPNGKASMKFKNVRPKKEQVKETISGTSFFQYREDLQEKISHRMMMIKVKYASTPGRPGKRISAPTRKMLATLSSYNSKGEASKAKATFNRAKEVWDVTLHNMDTRLYVRELKFKGDYVYWLSFDNVLPHMVMSGKKKIPKKDWMYFGDEYEYMTFRDFGKNFVSPEEEGMASVKSGTPTTDKELGAMDPELIGKSSEELEEMLKKINGAGSEMFSSYVEEGAIEGLFEEAFDDHGYEIESKLLTMLKEDAEEARFELFTSLDKRYQTMLNKIKKGNIKFSVTTEGEKLNLVGGKISDELFLNLPWFKEYLYFITDALDTFYMTSRKELTTKEANIIKESWRRMNTDFVGGSISDFEFAEPGEIEIDEREILDFIQEVKKDMPEKEVRKLQSFIGYDPKFKGHVPDDVVDEFEEKVPSYNMKGSSDEYFTIENYHKKSWITNEKYVHDDESVVVQYMLWRWASANVSAPNLVELVKKLEEDGGFDSRTWEDYDIGSKMDGYAPEGVTVLRGPVGLLPDTDAYEEWEESLDGNELYELGYEEDEWFDQCNFSPILITDEEGNKYVFTNGENVSEDDDAVMIDDAEDAEKVMSKKDWDEEPLNTKKRARYDKFFTAENIDTENWADQYASDYMNAGADDLRKNLSYSSFWNSYAIKSSDIEMSHIESMWDCVSESDKEDYELDIDEFERDLADHGSLIDWKKMKRKHKDDLNEIFMYIAAGAYDQTAGKGYTEWEEEEYHTSDHEDGEDINAKMVATSGEGSDRIYFGTDESGQYDEFPGISACVDFDGKAIDLEDFCMYIDRLRFEEDPRVEGLFK